MNCHSLRLSNQTKELCNIFWVQPGMPKMWFPLGMLVRFGGLTKVVIYPTYTSQLQSAVILAFSVLGQIDAGWQATWLAHKQLKHTNPGCSRLPWTQKDDQIKKTFSVVQWLGCLTSNWEVSGSIPTGGSSLFIHLLWYYSKEQFAVLFALFSIIKWYENL